MKYDEHTHQVSESRDWRYSGPVQGSTPNEAAHVNIVRIDVCLCGAERHTNINGLHVEQGEWSR